MANRAQLQETINNMKENLKMAEQGGMTDPSVLNAIKREISAKEKQLEML